MPKRFSLREITLLTAPVLAIGAVAMSAPKRSTSAKTPEQPRLTFRIDKPTTLETFEGAQGALVVYLQQPAPQFRISGGSAFFELQTPRGPIVLRAGTERKGWGKIWHGNINGTRFPVNISQIPPGALSFASQNILYPAKSSATRSELRGKWKIDRTQIKAPNFAAMLRKPLVSLREVKIVSITTLSGMRRVTGQATFQFEGAKMTNETDFQIRFTSDSGDLMTIYLSTSTIPKNNSRQRISEWTLDHVVSPDFPVRILGRASADNRWPIGFQIEPFNFKNAKVGQKLGFKQFPVALPEP